MRSKRTCLVQEISFYNINEVLFLQEGTLCVVNRYMSDSRIKDLWVKQEIV
jgi:hypothetical protein